MPSDVYEAAMGIAYTWRTIIHTKSLFIVQVSGITNPSTRATQLYADLPFIRVEWIVAPVDATAAQPSSRKATVRTFTITNATVALFAIVFRFRLLV